VRDSRHEQAVKRRSHGRRIEELPTCNGGEIVRCFVSRSGPGCRLARLLGDKRSGERDRRVRVSHSVTRLPSRCSGIVSARFLKETLNNWPSWPTIRREAKSVVSASLHFRRLLAADSGGTSVCCGSRESTGGSLTCRRIPPGCRRILCIDTMRDQATAAYLSHYRFPRTRDLDESRTVMSGIWGEHKVTPTTRMATRRCTST
jgi:hypothetical protein